MLCQDIHIVKANIALTRTEPTDVLICDPIPTTLTVRNIGSSPLTGVKVADTLPAGMNAGGESNLTFEVACLAAGDSTNFNIMPRRPRRALWSAAPKSLRAGVTPGHGKDDRSPAGSGDFVQAADQQYIGRKFDVSYTVSSTGDVPAAGCNLRSRFQPVWTLPPQVRASQQWQN